MKTDSGPSITSHRRGDGYGNGRWARATASRSVLARGLAVALVAPGTIAASFSASAADNTGWDWMVTPYAWATSIGMDLRTGQPPAGGTSADNDFDDVIDKLDGVFQAHIEGRGDRIGMFADFTYLGLADSHDHPRFRTDSDLDARLFELAAVWTPGADRNQGLGIFAGLRYIDVDLTVNLRPTGPILETTSIDGEDNYSDLMLGARYTWALSDRWGLTLRGDGSFGGTEGTWNASAVADYRMKRGAWLLGYRYMDVELESGGNEVDITMNGPMVGYGFKF